MRITLRLVAALVLSVTLVVGASTWIQVRAERARLWEDLERRAAILAETLDETVQHALSDKSPKRLSKVVERFHRREHLAGIAVFDTAGSPVALPAALERYRGEAAGVVQRALERGAPVSGRRVLGDADWHFYVAPLGSAEAPAGALLVVHDASFIGVILRETWWRNFWRLLAHAFIISLVALWVVRFNILAPMDQMAEWMRHVAAGAAAERLPPHGLPEPLREQAKELAKSLAQARAAAEEEAHLRQTAETVWTPERLKEHVKASLGGRPLVVVANREPYMHVHKGRRVEVVTPASGLVTGVEPVLLACGGLWVAHGAGDADRETCDETGKLQVPPGRPRYALRRVWLTKEEEEGYYYGLSNEGLWPLCHIAHARPVFKPGDWAHYQAVNRKFADALLEELAGQAEPCVLIQDYHFALLPALIKAARPDARVALFWHIPWPNPEAFGICPWQREILEGMLGADLLGFHIQYHCNNFIETVDRALESRIDRERFAVQRGEHVTLVKPFPISVAFPDPFAEPPPPVSKEALLKELGVQARWMCLGVDRLDYTKGIVERFRGVERLLERRAEFQGQFTLVQIGAPSRTHIPRYRQFLQEVEAEADRINWRFQTKKWRPIVLLNRHHSRSEIAPYYRAADVCLVTSLHDGMNLVAKEFVAARDDCRGALILSRFTGASRELRDALVVNPYDSDQLADALGYALEMDPEEQARRMDGMRRVLRENNVYRWAGLIVEDLAKVRLPERAAAA